MAHFYGEIQGNRGEATRMGTPSSGFRAHIRGWDIGVELVCKYDDKTDSDTIFVYVTGGSNDPCGNLILEVTKDKVEAKV